MKIEYKQNSILSTFQPFNLSTFQPFNLSTFQPSLNNKNVKLALMFLILSFKTFSQNLNYSNFRLGENSYVKLINTSKPVGIIGGEIGSTPSGAITYNIPIFTCPGTNNVKPEFSINYNSQNNSGNLGVGWNMTGLSIISRAGKNIFNDGKVENINFGINPINNSSEDVFLLDGLRLLPIIGVNGANATSYSTEVENFSRLYSFSNTPNNPDWFKVVTKDGAELEYGKSLDSRFTTDNGLFNMFWRLNRTKDLNGNYIDYEYENSGNESRISKIKYTGNLNTGLLPYNIIEFNYKIKKDRNEIYDSKTTFNNQHIINKIYIKHTNDLGLEEIVKTYQFTYVYDNQATFLQEVE